NPIRFRNRKNATSRVRVEDRRLVVRVGPEVGIAGAEVGIGIAGWGPGNDTGSARKGPALWPPAAVLRLHDRSIAILSMIERHDPCGELRRLEYCLLHFLTRCYKRLTFAAGARFHGAARVTG